MSSAAQHDQSLVDALFRHLASKPDAVGLRGYQALENAFHDHDIMFRISGDAIAMSPPLIVTEAQIGEIFDKVAAVIKQVA